MKDNGLIVGLTLAGLLGAGWVVLAATTGYGTTYLGIVFGLIAGVCVRLCAGAAHTHAGALSAGAIAVVAVFTAGFVASRGEPVMTPVEEEITDEAMIVSAAVQLADEWVMEGRDVPWPEGVNAATAAKQSDFPPALWQAACYQWQMTPPARKARCREARKVNLLRTRDENSSGRFGWVLGSVFFSAVAGLAAAATCVIGSD